MKLLLPVTIFGLLLSYSVCSMERTENFSLEIIKSKKNIILKLENLSGNACQLELDAIKITRSKHNVKGSIELTYGRNLHKECLDLETTILPHVIIERSNQLPGIGPNKGSYDIYINGEYYNSLRFFNPTGFETGNG